MSTSTLTRRRSPAEPGRSRRRGRQDTRIAMLFIAPALLGFLVFLAWPTVRGIWLSFTSFNLLTPS